MILVQKRLQVTPTGSSFVITVQDPHNPHSPPQPTDLMSNDDIVSFLRHLGLFQSVKPDRRWLNEFDLTISTDFPEPGDHVTVRCFNLDYATCVWCDRTDRPYLLWEDSSGLSGDFGNPCDPASKSLLLAAWLYEASEQDIFLTILPGLRLAGDDAKLQKYAFMLQHPIKVTNLPPVPPEEIDAMPIQDELE